MDGSPVVCLVSRRLNSGASWRRTYRVLLFICKFEIETHTTSEMLLHSPDLWPLWCQRQNVVVHSCSLDLYEVFIMYSEIARCQYKSARPISSIIGFTTRCMYCLSPAEEYTVLSERVSSLRFACVRYWQHEQTACFGWFSSETTAKSAHSEGWFRWRHDGHNVLVIAISVIKNRWLCFHGIDDCVTI